MTSEQMKLTKDGDLKESKLIVLVDTWSGRLCVLFKDTGQAAFISFNSWEHITSATSRKKVKHPHHKIHVLLPEDNVILCHKKGELSEKVREIMAAVKKLPCDGKGVSFSSAHCKPPAGYNSDGHECEDCRFRSK